MGYPLPGMQLHVVQGRTGSTVTPATNANAAANTAAGAQQYAQYARHQSAQRAYAYPVAINVPADGGGGPKPLMAAASASQAGPNATVAVGKYANERGVPEGAVSSGRPNDGVLSPTTGPAAATSCGGSSGGAADPTGGGATAAQAGAVFYAMNV